MSRLKINASACVGVFFALLVIFPGCGSKESKCTKSRAVSWDQPIKVGPCTFTFTDKDNWSRQKHEESKDSSWSARVSAKVSVEKTGEKTECKLRFAAVTENVDPADLWAVFGAAEMLEEHVESHEFAPNSVEPKTLAEIFEVDSNVTVNVYALLTEGEGFIGDASCHYLPYTFPGSKRTGFESFAREVSK